MISIITPTVRPKGMELVEKALRRQTFTDFEHLINTQRYSGGYWGLNRAYNDLIRKAKGELIVSWQDYTYATPQCLEKFWECYQGNPKSLVGATGHKYKDDSWSVVKWQDPRKRDDQGSFYECNPNDIEFNLASIPKQAFYDIGGFDEEMDFLGFGMDGISVVERLDDLGYKFYLDQANESFSLEHGRPRGWDKKNLLNGGYQNRKKILKRENKWPTLNYL